MGRIADVFSRVIDTVTEKTGRAVSLIALPIMLIITLEVVARYFFNNPTRWAWPLSSHLLGVLSLFGGAYALLHGSHIRVEVLSERFGAGLRLASLVLTVLCFLLFIGLLVWQGYGLAVLSLESREVIRGIIHFPVYPLKILLPVATLLFFLQGIALFLQRRSKRLPSDPMREEHASCVAHPGSEKREVGCESDGKGVVEKTPE